MNFKAQMQKDIHETFHNMNEFADLHIIVYDGNTLKLSVVVDSSVEEERKILADDYGDGVVQVDKVLYVALKDLGVTPKKGVSMTLDKVRYTVEQVDDEYGELIIYLGRKSQ